MNPEFKDVVMGTFRKELPYFAEDGVAGMFTKETELLSRLLSMRPHYINQDQFITITTLVDADNKFVAAGAAKRNPIDKQNTLRGRSLSLSRAVRQVIKAFKQNQQNE